MEIAIIIAIVTGLVQMFKDVGLNAKYAPIASILCAIALSELTCYNSMLQSEIIVQGLICGLSACGLYSGAKTLIRGAEK